jgi:hypothetical protein
VTTHVSHISRHGAASGIGKATKELPEQRDERVIIADPIVVCGQIIYSRGR